MNGVGQHDVDLPWMEQTLALAALGEGTTSPNPRVGCVLVREGRVVGSGYHGFAGGPHAEASAVKDAGERARGATAYVNLEPCDHHGRTSPCSELLLACGIRRVVASIADPNPLVNGRGFLRLQEGGVDVGVGLLEEPARRLNAPFLHWHMTGNPMVTLKAAISMDGMLSALHGRSRWITAPPARCLAHRLRFRHDAVLVGAGTVRQDDPALTVRLAGVNASSLRVVLSMSLDVDPGARVFGGGAATEPLPRIYASREIDATKAAKFEGRAEVVQVSSTGGRLNLDEVLADLGRLGVQSLLVEGGGRTLASFLDAGLAQRIALFVSPVLIGARGGTPLIDGAAVEDPAGGWRVDVHHRIPLSGDLFVLGDLVAPSPRAGA